MNIFLQELTHRVLSRKGISRQEAKDLLGLSGPDRMYLFAAANEIRLQYKGNRASLCAIVNAKSGECFEDCKFCAQSSRHNTNVAVYPLISAQEMLVHAEVAAKSGVQRFGIVTSGGELNDAEITLICEAVCRITAAYPKLIVCGSLGKINFETAQQLKNAGMCRYHHNIETAPELFSDICSTHSFNDRLETIAIAQKAGMQVCSGGILGLGETKEQRLEFLYILKDLGVDSVALNFLNPVPGTQMEHQEPVLPLDLITTIAIARFIMPEKDIRVCGGRVKNLRSLAALAFCAGADATITGDYLTTKGTTAEEDIQMLRDLGLDV